MNAKHQTPTSAVCAAMCAALFATSSQASARHPRARVESGTIETIEQNGRILRVQRQDEAGSLTLVWNSRTRFVKCTEFVTVAALNKGTRVTVWYHTPFFGERFATKIVIECGAVRPKEDRLHRSAAKSAMNNPSAKHWPGTTACPVPSPEGRFTLGATHGPTFEAPGLRALPANWGY